MDGRAVRGAAALGDGLAVPQKGKRRVIARPSGPASVRAWEKGRLRHERAGQEAPDGTIANVRHLRGIQRSRRIHGLECHSAVKSDEALTQASARGLVQGHARGGAGFGLHLTACCSHH